MNLRKTFFFGCIIASTACLGLGFGWVGAWGGVLLVTLASFLSWRAAYQKRSGWTDSAALIVSVIMAAAGLIFGALPAWMIIGAGFALGGWDLALFNRALEIGQFVQGDAAIERKHYASLGLVLVFGLLVGLLGRLIQVQLPFGVMVVLVLLALISLDRLWHMYYYR